MQTPLVVVYKTSALNYHLLKPIIKLDRIALVNIVAGKNVATELIQGDLHPVRLAGELRPLLNDSEQRRKMIAGLAEVKHLLGNKGAAKRVAQIVNGMLHHQGTEAFPDHK